MAVAMLFYGRLLELDPALGALFRVDMRDQSRKLMETLSAVVEAAEDFERLRPPESPRREFQLQGRAAGLRAPRLTAVQVIT